MEPKRPGAIIRAPRTDGTGDAISPSSVQSAAPMGCPPLLRLAPADILTPDAKPL